MELLTSRTRRAALVCVLGVAVQACIGVSPEQAEADALGPDTSGYSTGPYHRAGFPCTRCHGELWWQSSPVFELAGTIYQHGTDRRGVSGAEITVQDAAGHELLARTNRSGNFFLVRSGSELKQHGDGRFDVPFALQYPLHVSVTLNGQEQAMRGPIWREQSCAACHSGEPDDDSNGRVFVEDGP